MSPFECAGRVHPVTDGYVRCESGCQLTERNSAEKTPAIPIVKILTEVALFSAGWPAPFETSQSGTIMANPRLWRCAAVESARCVEWAFF